MFSTIDVAIRKHHFVLTIALDLLVLGSIIFTSIDIGTKGYRMIMNHSSFDILNLKTEVNNLRYSCLFYDCSCFNKKKSFSFYNYIKYSSLGFYCIRFDRYWYTRIEDVDES